VLGYLYCSPTVFRTRPSLLRLWNACQFCILPVKPLDFDLSLKDRFVRADFESSNVPQPVVAKGFIGAERPVNLLNLGCTDPTGEGLWRRNKSESGKRSHRPRDLGGPSGSQALKNEGVDVIWTLCAGISSTTTTACLDEGIKIHRRAP